MNLTEMKSKHKLLKDYSYTLGEIEKGYTNRTLHVDLGSNEIKEKPVTQLMKDKFIGGKGFGLKLLWDATKPDTKWDDPENEIIISPGPIGGITQYAGAGKSLVVALSPLTDIVIDSNVGGYFGPFLKYAGFDALELQGKAEKDVIVIIDGKEGVVRIEEAPEEAIDSHILAEQLTDMYAESESKKNLVSVVSAGLAADNSNIGVLNFSFYDKKRQKVRLKQAGRGGIGSVLRNKKIKAIVAIAESIKPDANHVVDMEAIKECGAKFNKEMRELDDDQCRMRKEGTAHLVEIMDDYDLLPTKNFQYGSHKDIMNIHSSVWRSKFTQGVFDGCWIGCTMSCAKAVDGFELKTGPYKGDKVIVDGPEYETVGGVGSNCGIFDADYIIEANFYCDTYGIDTISFGTLTAFVMECYEAGILNKELTGGLELNFGNAEAAIELMHQMARGEGFGVIAGLGIRKMKAYFAKEFGADINFLNDIGMENKGLEYSQYVSKESLA
ncbi:MAG: aldehyde:ferredoxin oxidoreductase, partial [Candidatus Cloacimonetes bacterium]|nr:aldehyde:ferredoxin oxidoreductase [Candidatus Cloacimonadota bacterium]